MTNLYAEGVVSGTADAQTLAQTIVPQLVSLTAPATTLIGKTVGRTGVSAQRNSVTVSTEQTVQTLNDCADVCALLSASAPRLTRLPASHHNIERGLRYHWRELR
jgi:hypothetical protein